MNTFGGIQVIESVHLVEDGEPCLRHLSWRERLFSWPWEPWVAAELEVPKVPARHGIMLNDHTMVIHPQTLKAMRAEFDQPCHADVLLELANAVPPSPADGETPA